MQAVSGWECAAAIMLVDYREMHYKNRLWPLVKEAGTSGLSEHKATPWETLGRELREHPELFSHEGEGCYKLKADAIPMILNNDRISSNVASLTRPLLEEYSSLILRLTRLACIDALAWSEELKVEEKEKTKRVQLLEATFRRVTGR